MQAFPVAGFNGGVVFVCFSSGDCLGGLDTVAMSLISSSHFEVAGEFNTDPKVTSERFWLEILGGDPHPLTRHCRA